MDNKTIKSERVKKIFAGTARNMIIEGGIESVTVRDVADQAGYAYPTLYNYFKSLDELLWYTRNMMILEVGEYIRDNIKTPPVNARGISELFRTYIDYYLKYPNVFRFFYFYHLEKGEDSSLKNGFDFDFEKQIAQIAEYFIKEKGFRHGKIITVLKTVLYSVHGMLMLHLSDNYNLAKDEIYRSLNEISELLLGK